MCVLHLSGVIFCVFCICQLEYSVRSVSARCDGAAHHHYPRRSGCWRADSALSERRSRARRYCGQPAGAGSLGVRRVANVPSLGVRRVVTVPSLGLKRVATVPSLGVQRVATVSSLRVQSVATVPPAGSLL